MKRLPLCHAQKAQHLDGFSFRFTKSLWDVFNQDIYETVNEFWFSSLQDIPTNQHGRLPLQDNCETAS